MAEETKLNFVIDNNVYIYGDIDETIPENIVAPLISLIQIRARERNPEPIRIFISSDGGYLHYAFDIIAAFEQAAALGVKIITIVTSHAYSAASLIAVCGHERFATKRADHLIHYARQWSFAHNPEMSKRNSESDKFSQAQLVKIYKDNTKLKNIEKILIADNYIISGGQDLLKYGLIDKIL